MRFLLAVSLLALACSTKTSTPDAQSQDTGADTSPDTATDDTGFGGYPKCTFTATTSSTACNLAACLFRDAGSDPGDADAVGCWPCPDGYACAIVCPSPLGGCGPPTICCPVSP